MPSLAKILVPVDFSERSLGAALYARALARHTDSEVTLFHVITPLPYEFGALEGGGAMLSEIYNDRAQQVERELNGFLIDELAGCRVKRVAVEGDPAQRIVEYAHQESTDLIVMPTHGYGTFRRFIVGSNTAKVLHDAECPVWTGVHIQDAPLQGDISINRILCAIDLGPQTCRTLTWAAGLQRAFGARLTVIHALACADDPAAESLEQSVRQEVHRFEKTAGMEAEVFLEAGDASKVVCEAAGRTCADLLVIGRGSAAGGFGRLRTHAYAMIRQSPCPVVSV
jgi:nucleotide-binding universal stress UspA family protein